jgi:hypothetical protein
LVCEEVEISYTTSGDHKALSVGEDCSHGEHTIGEDLLNNILNRGRFSLTWVLLNSFRGCQLSLRQNKCCSDAFKLDTASAYYYICLHCGRSLTNFKEQLWNWRSGSGWVGHILGFI